MGGDFAPGEIILGARRAVDELGLAVIARRCARLDG